jgi:hypothetical protein
MQARTLISLTASLLITGATLALFQVPAKPLLGPIPQMRASTIDGIPVYDLPDITVRPTAAEVRAAFTQGRRTAGIELLHGLTGNGDDALSISSHLTMPYYSFGAELGQISKD